MTASLEALSAVFQIDGLNGGTKGIDKIGIINFEIVTCLCRSAERFKFTLGGR